MINTKLTFALAIVVAGLAGASQAQAGAGNYQIGSSQFADRCLDNGGDVYGDLSCDLGEVQIDCTFSGVKTYCEWDGAQNKRAVVRVLGMATAESLSEAGGGQSGKKKTGKDMMLDLDFSP
jgi:hypothetical protein